MSGEIGEREFKTKGYTVVQQANLSLWTCERHERVFAVDNLEQKTKNKTLKHLG